MIAVECLRRKKTAGLGGEIRTRRRRGKRFIHKVKEQKEGGKRKEINSREGRREGITKGVSRSRIGVEVWF